VRGLFAETVEASGVQAEHGGTRGRTGASKLRPWRSMASTAGWSVAWSPLCLLLAVLLCVAVGVGFGVYPARQAAALDPIAALRSDG
jgi:ABC-type antimicrobial peptide transport system permease subunit